MPTDRLREILTLLASREGSGSGTARLCEVAAEVSGTSGAGFMLLSDDLARGSLCSTGGLATYLDDLQYTLGEGPAVDAHRNGKVVFEPDLDSPSLPRWTVLAPLAVRAGVRGIFGFPVRIGAVRLGALTLYRDRSGPLDDNHYADALIKADVAARTIVDLQSNTPQSGVALKLEGGANFHFVVHQAAGMTSVQLQITITEALIRLRGHAFRTDQSIDEVARAVVGRHLRLDASDGR